jgi:hypothetical protein
VILSEFGLILGEFANFAGIVAGWESHLVSPSLIQSHLVSPSQIHSKSPKIAKNDPFYPWILLKLTIFNLEIAKN